MSYGLSIRISRSDWSVEGLSQGYRLRIEILDSNLPDPAIFRYKRYDLQPGATEYTYECDGVASIPDIEQYPEYSVRETEDPAYFRLDTLDKIFRSLSSAILGEALFREEMMTLCETYALLDQVVTTEDVLIGELDSSSSAGA